MTRVENNYSHYHSGTGLAGDHRRVSGTTQIEERYERSIEGITTQPEVPYSVPDQVVSLVLYFAAKYASPSLAEDVKMVIGLLQLPVTAIIVAISVEDSAAMKAGTFLPDRRGSLKPLLSLMT